MGNRSFAELLYLVLVIATVGFVVWVFNTYNLASDADKQLMLKAFFAGIAASVFVATVLNRFKKQ